MIEAVKILSRYVYPSIKRRLVEIMKHEFGLSQKEIANHLYISQSLISRYLNKNRGHYLDLSKAEKTDREIKNLANEIVNKNKISPRELEFKLTLIALRALGRGDICQFHNQIDPKINPNECNMCKKLFGIFPNKNDVLE